jgi:hypothetical protein
MSLALFVSSLVFYGAQPSSAKSPDEVLVVNSSTFPVPASVSNTAEAPLWVRDVDNPARAPFAQMLTFSIANGAFQGEATITVPAGKHLVIEYVSGRSEFNPSSFGFGGPVIYGALNSNGKLIYFPWTNPTSNTSLAGQMMRADVFGTAQLFVERTATNGAQDVKVTVTGYLVDLP